MILLLLFISYVFGAYAQEAIVIKPVINLIGKPLRELYGIDDPALYNTIGLSPVGNDEYSRPRLHQLVYHERVRIIEERGNEVLVELPEVFYQKWDSTQKYNQFWTLRSHLMLLEDLKGHGVDITKLPAPTLGSEQPLVTLMLPFHGYSAGTRFVYKDISDGTVEAYALACGEQSTLVTIALPANICLIDMYSKPLELKIATFVKLLQTWSHAEGFIPYALGGNSFTCWCYDEAFGTTQFSINGHAINVYTYPTYSTLPQAGFDCSGLILSAAQMCGLPFFFKNTTTMWLQMGTLGAGDSIEAGDLILIPRGHVIAITDVQQGLCVEARGYGTGYGKVHEIPLNKLFKGIDNFEELRCHFVEQRPLLLLNRAQEVTQEIPAFKILKLASIIS